MDLQNQEKYQLSMDRRKKFNGNIVRCNHLQNAIDESKENGIMYFKLFQFMQAFVLDLKVHFPEGLHLIELDKINSLKKEVSAITTAFELKLTVESTP